MFWWSVFSFDGINNAAQTPQCLETSYTLKHTCFSTYFDIIYIFVNDDWPCLRFDDGVALFREFRPKTWGPCNKLKFLERKRTHLTSKCLEMYKTYWSMVSLSVAKYYRIAWLTVQCWRSWRCSLHSNLKQEIQIFRTPPLKNEINHFLSRVYKHGVCWNNHRHHQSS